MSDASYIGRFAPSPTGPLHFGSLVAALGSYLQARSQDGTWLVRIEDIDPPREVPGSADAILRALETYGLNWDGSVLYQSTRTAAYRETITRLLDNGRAFRCRCSRRLVAQNPGGIYAGRCRLAQVPASRDHSVRLLTDQHPIRFVDALQGPIEQDLEKDVGDFVIQRRDGLIAYQLAVTVDDDYQGVTEVVRGCDLLGTTPRQIHLRRVSGLSQPAYLHLPVVLDHTGEKLSKRAGAAALPAENRSKTLFRALEVLWQIPPSELQDAPPTEQLSWAEKNWNIRGLQNISAVELDEEKRILRHRGGPVAVQQFDPQ